MVPLILKQVGDAPYAEFSITRVQTGVFLEAALPGNPPEHTFVDGVLIDPGSGYTILPHKVHSREALRIYQELGQRPYRIISSDSPAVMQRFAEIGLRFLARQPNGSYRHWPDNFVKVKAYLLDADTRPKGVVLIGLDTLLENFILHLEKGNSYLAALNSAPAPAAGVNPPAETDSAAPDRQ